MAEPTTADPNDCWPDYGACRRCHTGAFSRDGKCPECGWSMLVFDSNGNWNSDGHATPGEFRALAGLTILSRADLPPDVQAELDGHIESLRETRRHDLRWVRVKLDGIHLYMSGPLPAGSSQHRLTAEEAASFAAWRADGGADATR